MDPASTARSPLPEAIANACREFSASAHDIPLRDVVSAVMELYLLHNILVPRC